MDRLIEAAENLLDAANAAETREKHNVLLRAAAAALCGAVEDRLLPPETELAARTKLVALMIERAPLLEREDAALWVDDQLQKLTLLTKKVPLHRQAVARIAVADLRARCCVQYGHFAVARKLLATAIAEASSATGGIPLAWVVQVRLSASAAALCDKDVAAGLRELDTLQGLLRDADASVAAFAIAIARLEMALGHGTLDDVGDADAAVAAVETAAPPSVQAHAALLRVIAAVAHGRTAEANARLTVLQEKLEAVSDATTPATLVHRGVLRVPLPGPGRATLTLAERPTPPQLLAMAYTLSGALALQQDPRVAADFCAEAVKVAQDGLARAAAAEKDRAAWFAACRAANQLLLTQCALMRGQPAAAADHLAQTVHAAPALDAVTRVAHRLLEGMLWQCGGIQGSFGKLQQALDAASRLAESTGGATTAAERRAAATLKLAAQTQLQLAAPATAPTQNPADANSPLTALQDAVTAFAENRIKATKIKTLECIQLADAAGAVAVKAIALAVSGTLYINTQPAQAEKMFRAAYSHCRRLQPAPLTGAVCGQLQRLGVQLGDQALVAKFGPRAQQLDAVFHEECARLPSILGQSSDAVPLAI